MASKHNHLLAWSSIFRLLHTFDDLVRPQSISNYCARSGILWAAVPIMQKASAAHIGRFVSSGLLDLL
eukprot:SAG11_NODE_27160_length_336_cov_0.645570_1_plen_67_part_10